MLTQYINQRMLTRIAENLLIKLQRFQIIGQSGHNLPEFIFAECCLPFHLRKQKILTACRFFACNSWFDDLGFFVGEVSIQCWVFEVDIFGGFLGFSDRFRLCLGLLRLSWAIPTYRFIRMIFNCWPHMSVGAFRRALPWIRPYQNRTSDQKPLFCMLLVSYLKRTTWFPSTKS